MKKLFKGIFILWVGLTITITYRTNAISLAEKMEPAMAQKIIAAKKILKTGVNTWDPEIMKESREKFLGLLARAGQDNLYVLYYVALCDYRLANYYIASQEMEKAETYIQESKIHLLKAMEIDNEFGELDALYAYMLGFEIALDQEKAMSLGLQIFQYMEKALDKSPDNPRVHYLKGISELYTPVQYGGGADAATKTLGRSVELFAKENITEGYLPSWGKEEAYTFLGMAYSQKGEKEKAKEMYTRALAVNPEFGLAAGELRKIKE
ncbi:MAG: tetratricopeptide repeat protein [Candidatus Aminicenantes bacterium]|nr:tetratricopeptide repeat protein [Candidatus Aminicenantes bacterium]